MKRINLSLDDKSDLKKRRTLRKTIGKLMPTILVVAIFVCLAIFIATFSSGSSVFNYIFLGSGLKSNDDKVNVLILGIGGGTHEGANLTDTIMVASYNLKTNQAYLISVPRDLWLPSLKSKANAAYEIGLGQGSGLSFAKTVMGNVVGLPVQYGVRVDFNGFIKAVDILGGIDVDVARSFDDYNYPIEGKENDLCGYQEKEMDFSEEDAKKLNIEPGKRKVFIAPDGKIATNAAQEDQGAKYFTCRYEHISFTKGITHMDGVTALKYVRSRHGTNGEGSDFARSARQERAIQAIRKKVLSVETLANPAKISQLLGTLGRSVDTDITPHDAVDFYNLSKKLDKTHTIILDDSYQPGLPNGRTSLLVHPNPADFGGAYVLVSEDDDFSIVQNYVRKKLQETDHGEATSSARTGSH